jgi:hypothetical protein
LRRAYLNLRYTVPERRSVFTEGLKRLGYDVIDGLTRDPRDGDLLVSWNRITEADTVAKIFESRGLKVLITENSSWGNSFAGRNWYTICRNYHNVAKTFPEGGSERWDRLGVDLAPWRNESEYPDTVILAARGIGPACHRTPSNWTEQAINRCRREDIGSGGGTTFVRQHPGRSRSQIPLEENLRKCWKAVTWGSGAAVKALMWGIRVESHMPNWIAEQDNTNEGRLAMFRRLAWAQWTLDDIGSGYAFARLLG